MDNHVIVFFAAVLATILSADAEVRTSSLGVRSRWVRRVSPDVAHVDWDRSIDLWLNKAKRDLEQRDLLEIPVDDIVEEFTSRSGFLKFQGRFTATQGALSDVSTLGRRSKVSVVKEPMKTKVTTTLGWDNLTLKFGYFKLEMLGFQVQGDMKGIIQSNSVEISFDFKNVDGECVTTLNDLKIIEFGDLDLKVNGLGPLNVLASQVIHLVADNHRRTIIRNTETKLEDLVIRSLVDYHCEEEAIELGLPLN